MFVRVPTDQSIPPIADHLSQVILEKLNDKRRVLWLISGGSAIPVAVEAAARLKGHRLEGLTVSLVDERYGSEGHADSNWQQLIQAGFRLESATLVPVLSGQSLQETTDSFDRFLTAQVDAGVYILALLGIGLDGHTAGILPRSSAATAAGFVHAYEGGGYQRITTTFPFIERLDEAVVYAIGDTKRTALDDLERDTDPKLHPAQILKLISKITIFNDYKGEERL